MVEFTDWILIPGEQFVNINAITEISKAGDFFFINVIVFYYATDFFLCIQQHRSSAQSRFFFDFFLENLKAVNVQQEKHLNYARRQRREKEKQEEHVFPLPALQELLIDLPFVR